MALGYASLTTIVAWLMATLTPSPFMVALVQTANTLPALVFGLFAGALADIVDRRRVIFVTQLLLFAASVVMGIVTLAGMASAGFLLALVFVLGAGYAFYIPAQQAVINDLVPHDQLPAAMALATSAFTGARAAGPALAAVLIALLDSGGALLASALCFLGMIVSLRGWKSPSPGIKHMPERLLSGIRSGLRFTRHSPPMRALGLYSFCFSFCACSLLALLPVMARDQFHLGATGFGLLQACFGTGAVLGGMSLPRLLQRSSLHRMVLLAMTLSAVGMLILAATPYVALAALGVSTAGIGWGAMFSALGVGTQSAVPAWVRARAISIGLVIMQVALATGSMLWGALASASAARVAMIASAVLLLALIVLNRRIRLSIKDREHTTTGIEMPEMTVIEEPGLDDGPILIQIEYHVAAEQREEFQRRIRDLEMARRRNGASEWRLFRDLEQDGRFVERYIVVSWGEYLRQRSRMTVKEGEIQAQVSALQRPEVPIGVSRLIAVDRFQ